MRLGQKMDNGQTDRDTFVPWPAHCSHVVLNLTVYKYIEETKPACIIPCGSGWGTTRTGRLTRALAPRVLSVVKAIAELPLIGDLSLVRRVRVGGYFRSDET